MRADNIKSFRAGLYDTHPIVMCDLVSHLKLFLHILPSAYGCHCQWISFIDFFFSNTKYMLEKTKQYEHYLGSIYFYLNVLHIM